ncbi:hypothetical protein NDU88_005547 [Pleurodeles waltl]|uniref:Uncharacterized protein n=1 Tax=Pleurodeles waltl TaxID=8319 RepID=A0AAV7VLD8_PLEWA|nr:hypothetical protein NDU88_005547 [Pleurodeles waltl]
MSGVAKDNAWVPRLCCGTGLPRAMELGAHGAPHPAPSSDSNDHCTAPRVLRATARDSSGTSSSKDLGAFGSKDISIQANVEGEEDVADKNMCVNNIKVRSLIGKAVSEAKYVPDVNNDIANTLSCSQRLRPRELVLGADA